MADINNVLVEAKLEYTNQLIQLLSTPIFTIFTHLYNKSKEQPHSNYSILQCFQIEIKNIPQWNQSMIDDLYHQIIQESKCDWIDELLTAVFYSHAKILTSVRNGSQNFSRIDLRIPNISTFIHKCIVECARQFYMNPFLFLDDIPLLEMNRNRRDAIQIIKESINETIRKLLPIKSIINEYLGLNPSSTPTPQQLPIQQVPVQNQFQQFHNEIQNNMNLNVNEPEQEDEEDVTSYVSRSSTRRIKKLLDANKAGDDSLSIISDSSASSSSLSVSKVSSNGQLKEKLEQVVEEDDITADDSASNIIVESEPESAISVPPSIQSLQVPIRESKKSDDEKSHLSVSSQSTGITGILNRLEFNKKEQPKSNSVVSVNKPSSVVQKSKDLMNDPNHLRMKENNGSVVSNSSRVKVENNVEKKITIKPGAGINAMSFRNQDPQTESDVEEIKRIEEERKRSIRERLEKKKRDNRKYMFDDATEKDDY
jgi:hypothetical protein